MLPIRPGLTPGASTCHPRQAIGRVAYAWVYLTDLPLVRKHRQEDSLNESTSEQTVGRSDGRPPVVGSVRKGRAIIRH